MLSELEMAKSCDSVISRMVKVVMTTSIAQDTPCCNGFCLSKGGIIPDYIITESFCINTSYALSLSYLSCPIMAKLAPTHVYT